MFSILIVLEPNIFAQPIIYWTDRESRGTEARIHRFYKGVKQDLVSFPLVRTPTELALDVNADKMYWADFSNRQINRANLDGTFIETIYFPNPGFSLWGVAVDAVGGKFYWTEPSNTNTAGFAIRRANIDGSSVENLITTGLIQPKGIVLDILGGKMYWVETVTFTGRIRRANIDGSDMEDIVTGLGAPYGIALDVNAGKMYWTEVDADRIMRANLDGSNMEPLIERSNVTGEPQNPIGIDLDLIEGKIYWTDGDLGKIVRANLDGTMIEDVLVDLQNPIGISLDLTPPDFQIVSIDIKPGNYPNSINPNSNGLISVAILTTSVVAGESLDFDATTVDPNSVAFGPNRAKEYHRKGHIEDVDGDGDLDLLLHFKTQETGIQCGDVTATLTGVTNNIKEIEGTDNINTVGCSSKQSYSGQMVYNIIPNEFILYQNHPNPFNSTTIIRFGLSDDQKVSISIYSITGEKVITLVDNYLPKGHHQVTWNGINKSGNKVASGIYLYEMRTKDKTFVKNMLLSK